MRCSTTRWAGRAVFDAAGASVAQRYQALPSTSSLRQVIEVRFPGFPAPPLGLLFKLVTSIENWLAADPANVAVVHCMVRVPTATATAADDTMGCHCHCHCHCH